MRIAIVNDSRRSCQSIREAVEGIGRHEIIWVASDGGEAVTRCAAERPDLILMALLMPGMDGVEATRRIMLSTKTPILIVTSTVATNANRVFEALRHGALDAVDAPEFAEAGAQPLIAKLETLERLLGRAPRRHCGGAGELPTRVQVPPLIAIGSSTGGPGALASILGKLSPKLGAAVVVVQHLDARFVPGLVTWLAPQTGLEVRAITPGDRPTAGTVLIAATDDHLVIEQELELTYVTEPANVPYRPSVDVFFKALARHWPEAALAVLLTGMGQDGASGMAELRRGGWHTIAQDQESSVIYGMPKAAVELGAVVATLPLARIGGELCAWATGRARV